jgi:signal transduction histidine kinase
MKPEIRYFQVGPRLTLTFILLVALILAGNSLLVWQFRIASNQTERLTGANQQVIAVLRLQKGLLSVHQQLAEVVLTMDAAQVVAEADVARNGLLDQIQKTRTSVTQLPAGTRVDPLFLPTLDAILLDLPSQIDAISALAELGAWADVRIRLAKGMRVMEDQIAMLVKSIDQGANEELTNTTASMRVLQRRILTIVPIMAISTFSIASFFAWAVARRMVELRLEERVNERMRIAGELHDNLLQQIIGAKMLVNVAKGQLETDSPATRCLTQVAEIMNQAINDGRNTIQGFRLHSQGDQDLERAFSTVQQQLQSENQIDCRVHLRGRPRALRPAILNDVYAIGREALVNSFRHSGAGWIEIDLEYTDHLRVLVRDDGCGIDQGVLQTGRKGHFGLTGMRERAERIGAEFKVLARTEGGTEMELCVPGNIAFAFVSPSLPISRIASFYTRFRRTRADA